jgi:hypothetical protein
VATSPYTKKLDANLHVVGDVAIDGVATGPTASVGTNTTQLATTAFVHTGLQLMAEATAYMDGAGAALDNTWEASVRIPFAATIVESVGGINPSGSISIDVYKAADGSYGTWTKISASAPIAISSGTEHKDTTLTGWTTAITAGDWIRFVVTSATTCTRASIGLKLQRS